MCLIWRTQVCVPWDHQSHCAGFSPFFSALCRSPLVQIKPSVLVLSQALLCFCLQSKETHTHHASGNGDERLGFRNRKWTLPWKKLLWAQLYWAPDLRSHLSSFWSKILTLRDLGFNLGSGKWVSHLGDSAQPLWLLALGEPFLQFQWEPPGSLEFWDSYQRKMVQAVLKLLGPRTREESPWPYLSRSPLHFCVV